MCSKYVKKLDLKTGQTGLKWEDATPATSDGSRQTGEIATSELRQLFDADECTEASKASSG